MAYRYLKMSTIPNIFFSKILFYLVLLFNHNLATSIFNDNINDINLQKSSNNNYNSSNYVHSSSNFKKPNYSIQQSSFYLSNNKKPSPNKQYHNYNYNYSNHKIVKRFTEQTSPTIFSAQHQTNKFFKSNKIKFVDTAVINLDYIYLASSSKIFQFVVEDDGPAEIMGEHDFVSSLQDKQEKNDDDNVKKPQNLIQYDSSSEIFKNDLSIVLFQNKAKTSVIEYCLSNSKSNFHQCFFYNFETKILKITNLQSPDIKFVINFNDMDYMAIGKENFENQNSDSFAGSSVISVMNRDFGGFNLNTDRNRRIDRKSYSDAPEFLDQYFQFDGKLHLFYHQTSSTNNSKKLYLAILCTNIVLENSESSFNPTTSDTNIKSFSLSSLTEIELDCSVLIDIFRNKAISIAHIQATNEFAVLYDNNKICRFSLNRIYSRMYNSWDRCTSSSDNNAIPWVKTSSDKCWQRPDNMLQLIKEELVNEMQQEDKNFCLDFKKIYLRQPLFQRTKTSEKASKFINLSRNNILPKGSRKITSIISSNRNDQVVIFGTDTSELFKFSFANNQLIRSKNWHLGKDFGSILDGQVSNSGKLFARSNRGFILISLDDCSQFTDCVSCSGNLETSCGWCALEGKCVPDKECRNSALSPINQIQSCPKLAAVEPVSFSSEETYVEFSLTALSIPGSYEYNCYLYSTDNPIPKLLPKTAVYSKSIAEERGNTPTSRTLACEFRSQKKQLDLLKNILKTNVEIQKLNLLLVYKNVVISGQQITVFNCQKFSTCTSCLAKKFDDGTNYKCYWSILDNRCSRTGNDFEHSSTENSVVFDKKKCPYLKPYRNVFLGPKFRLFDGKSINLEAVANNTANHHLKFELLNQNLPRLKDQKSSFFSQISFMENMNQLYSDRCQLLPSTNIIDCQIKDPLRITKTEQHFEHFAIQIYQQNRKLQKFLIEPLFIQTVYECKSSKSCGECLYNSHMVKASCGWNTKQNLCQDKNLISDAQQKEDLVLQVCPYPKIIDFNPKLGVNSGGSTIKILGKDLPFYNNQFIVKIGQINFCVNPIVVFNSDSKNFEITCQLSKNNNHYDNSFAANNKYKISITSTTTNHLDIKSVSEQEFEYVIPKIYKVFPSHAPVSGGTSVTLSGKYLDLVKNSKDSSFVTIQQQSYVKKCVIDYKSVQNNQFRCRIENVKENTKNLEIECKYRIKEETAVKIASITLQLNNEEIVSKQDLTIRPDPCVDSLTPNWSISSGGLDISVRGKGFKNGEKYFMINSQQKSLNAHPTATDINQCKIISDSNLSCVSPPIYQAKNNNLQISSSYAQQINFILDGTRFSSGGLLMNYYPTPKIDSHDKAYFVTESTNKKSSFLTELLNFNNKNTQIANQSNSTNSNNSNPQTSNALLITGKGLCAFTPNGYQNKQCGQARPYFKILIDNKLAEIKAMTDETITCYPPKTLKTGKYEIKVLLGQNFNINAGTLQYKAGPGFLSKEVIFISIGSLCLILAFISIIVCRQQSKVKTAVNEKKLLQDKMIYEQSKKLQTEKNDMFNILVEENQSLNNEGHDHEFYDRLMAQELCFKEYAFRILFKKDNFLKYSVLLNGQNSETNFYSNGPNSSENVNNLNSLNRPVSHNYQMKMRTLEELKYSLEDKEFLSTVIKVLDNNLTAAEKSNISAFLIIIFSDRFDYITEILMSSLSLIIRDSKTNSSERAFLRQSISVYEKMINHWIGLLMYPFLTENVSKSLYLLYRGLRDTVFKGPVDCITGQARNTLAQESQLKTEICDREGDIKSIPIIIIDPSTDDITKVKVLTCDTVTQVKHKIILKLYGPTVSYRPSIDDFALFYLGHPVNSPNTKQDGNNFNLNQTFPIELYDSDNNSFINPLTGHRKINTLSHYKIFSENSKFALVNKNTAQINYQNLVKQAAKNSISNDLEFNNDTNSLGNNSAAQNLVTAHGASASFTLPPPPIFPPSHQINNMNGSQSTLPKGHGHHQGMMSTLSRNQTLNRNNSSIAHTNTSLLSRITNMVGNQNQERIALLSNNNNNNDLNSMTMPRPEANNFNIHDHRQSLHSKFGSRYSSRQQSSASINRIPGATSENIGPERNYLTGLSLPVHHGNQSSVLSTLQIASRIADGIGNSVTNNANSKDDIDTGIGTLSSQKYAQSDTNNKIYHLIQPKTESNGKNNLSLGQNFNETGFAPILYTKQRVKNEINSLFQSILCRRSNLVNDTFNNMNTLSSQVNRELFEQSHNTLNQRDNHNNQNLITPPLCVKFLFRFFDEVAANLEIEDEIVHIWKSNSLMLRFWMDIISEPTTLLDVDFIQPVQSSMRVIATALMESCSVSEYNYTRDTPANKLLYATDVTSAWNFWIKDYFSYVTEATEEKPFNYQQSLEIFRDSVAQMSQELYSEESIFDVKGTLNQFLPYVIKYGFGRVTLFLVSNLSYDTN